MRGGIGVCGSRSENEVLGCGENHKRRRSGWLRVNLFALTGQASVIQKKKNLNVDHVKKICL